ncbi:TIGR03000 domain-containing protein [Fimbriiglobus ruber]|uniref:ATP-dependent RNA helicase A n=1 Tax=Fimbriiglobus ruber TaxID=1908690 RepID=A0A225DBP0_9BACT|nr:TIGR03000 domain-containing protein [Fimbriiglobus ruber]OWK34569.1 ATP-dependent RNA helicase A [Fimbriiglobus ruber]
MNLRSRAFRSLPPLVMSAVVIVNGSPVLAAGGHGGGAGHVGAVHGGYYGGYGPGFHGGYYGGYGGYYRGGYGYGYPYYGFGLGLGLGYGYGYGMGYGAMGYGYGGYGYGYGGYGGYGFPYYNYGTYNSPPGGNPSYAAASFYPPQGGPGPVPPQGGPQAPPPSNMAMSTLTGAPPTPLYKPSDTDVTLVVRTPADAVVWINGARTTQTGPKREFVSTGPAPGRSYTFAVRAQWTGADGKRVDLLGHVPIQAGEKRLVDFTTYPQGKNETAPAPTPVPSEPRLLPTPNPTPPAQIPPSVSLNAPLVPPAPVAPAPTVFPATPAPPAVTLPSMPSTPPSPTPVPQHRSRRPRSYSPRHPPRRL